MKLGHKAEIAEQAIRSISMHDDADFLLRDAALARLEAFIVNEREEAKLRLASKLSEEGFGLQEN